MAVDDLVLKDSSQTCQRISGEQELAFEINDIKRKLREINKACFVVKTKGQICFTTDQSVAENENCQVIATINPLTSAQFGDIQFCRFYDVSQPYYAGSMAKGLSSVELVVALGKAGILASFGSGGLSLSEIEQAIIDIQSELIAGPYAFNLIHIPGKDELERKTIDLFLNRGINVIETSAFLDLTPHIVRYRAAGLCLDSAGNIHINNKIIVKLSRKEIAAKFMVPPPERILSELVAKGEISEQQAKLAAKIPVADDITVEADSGGHTDNRPLVSLLPSIIALKNEIESRHQLFSSVRIGAGGGISTPESALAAFMMGAAYVVSGSVNQACIESGASNYVKNLLAKTKMTDVVMAPASDMFELGAKEQVIKRGTLFAMRASKLYDLYRTYNSIEEIPSEQKDWMEKQIFQNKLEDIWQSTILFFRERDPKLIEKAQNDPKTKMVLIFKWYLRLSSSWAQRGEKGRENDYQIWSGPAMGAFNDWVKGSYLEKAENRRVVDVAKNILNGAAYLYRIQSLKIQGVPIPSEIAFYNPIPTINN